MTDVFAVFLQREDDAGDVTAAVDRAAADRQEAVRRPVRPGGRHAGRRRDRPTRCPGGARPLAPRGARPQTSHQRTLAGARSRTTQVHRRLTPVMLTIQTVARNSCTVYQFKLCLIVSVRRSLTRTTLLTLMHGTCGHKGGLLQLSSLGYFWTTVTMAAACLQRRRSLLQSGTLCLFECIPTDAALLVVIS